MLSYFGPTWPEVQKGRPRLNNILDYAIENKCSDVHLMENHYVSVRMRGEIAITDYAVDIREFMEWLGLPDSPGDFSFEYGDTRIRGNLYYSYDGINIVLRILNNNIPTIEQIRLPALAEFFAAYSSGLVLVTGTVGNGKTTTLAAIIELINQTRNVSILTIENPIEYVYKSKRARISQREIGTHVGSFAEAAIGSMRQDADVIMLGEIRDYAEIESAILLAETGRLVFATLHTKGVTATADRLVASYPPASQDQARVQIASVLRGVIHQRLVPDKYDSRLPLVEIMTVDNIISSAILKKSGNYRDHIRSDDNCVHLADNVVWHIRNGDLDLKAVENILSGDDYSLVKSMLGGGKYR